MPEDIMVVGGYGHVGQTICAVLGELFPGHVIAAGGSPSAPSNSAAPPAGSFLQGQREADMTARVAAAAAEIVYRSPLPRGVFHIEQAFEWEDILPAIRRKIGTKTSINGVPVLA